MLYKKLHTFTIIFTGIFLIGCLSIFYLKDIIVSNIFLLFFSLLLSIIFILTILSNKKDVDDKSSDLSNDKNVDNKSSQLTSDDICKEYDSDKVAGVKNIINSHNDNSFFSLALIGDWGSGKSSFLKKLEDEIHKEKKDIIIYLNVWELENIQNILQEIEKEFDNIIFKHDKIKWTFYHLRSILIKNYFSLLSKYFTENNINITSPFSNTIKDSKNEYNKLLQRVLEDKKIVLILDELDRLEAKEDIQNIFKIIRYLTSFDKVFTITGVDLNKLPKEIELDYIHKIFNSKYVIPKTSRSELLTFLREEGSNQLSDFIDKEKFNNILNTNINKIDLCLIDFIRNYREAKSILNDTCIICNSLKKIPNWNKFISFEFILVLNIIKSVNLEFYLNFMNAKENIKLIIMKDGKIKGKSYIQNTPNKVDEHTLNEYEQNKLDEFLIFDDNIFNIFKIFKMFIFNYQFKNPNQQLYIYTHQNIYEYMFTENDYKDFLEGVNKIKKKINKLIKDYPNKSYKEKFIILLINRLYEEENKENRLKVIKTIFTEEEIKYSLDILDKLLESNYTLNVMEELFKFNLNRNSSSDENSKQYIDSFIIKVISKNRTNDLIRFLFNNVKGTIYEKNFKNHLLQFKYISEDKNKLIELHDIITTILDEDYNTFFNDEETYPIYYNKDSNSFKIESTSGKEIRKMIKENIELENKGQ